MFTKSPFLSKVSHKTTTQFREKKESVSVESSRELLLDRVWLGKVAFADWIGEAKTREVLVNRFLAVLECLKLQVLQLEDETELILVPGSNFQTIEGGIHA